MCRMALVVVLLVVLGVCSAQLNFSTGWGKRAPGGNIPPSADNCKSSVDTVMLLYKIIQVTKPSTHKLPHVGFINTMHNKHPPVSHKYISILHAWFTTGHNMCDMCKILFSACRPRRRNWSTANATLSKRKISCI